jgi:hypothetical protein
LRKQDVSRTLRDPQIARRELVVLGAAGYAVFTYRTASGSAQIRIKILLPILDPEVSGTSST